MRTHGYPGHGVDDFIVCQKYPEIPTVVPVDAEGRLTEEAGQFAGLTTDEANKPIAEHLEKIGALFALKKIVHQYPHCWRCHKPIIFRATSQWFCSVDDFKEAAVAATEDAVVSGLGQGPYAVHDPGARRLVHLPSA